MTRLDTIRLYFIERFINAISSDPRLTGLSHPVELFDSSGLFSIPPDAVGFQRLPTYKNLIQRINNTTSPQEKNELQTFLGILLNALHQITGGLGTFDYNSFQILVDKYAPQIRQHDEQTFTPISVEDFLNFQDGTLTAQFFTETGHSSLRGQIFDLMFNNPIIPQLTNLPEVPYQAKVPFVSTVGIDPSIAAFPDSPLNIGRLNLSAADARFGPGQVQPTLYAEIKSISGSLILNREYDDTAAYAGRYELLRNNRIHKDPLVNLDLKPRRAKVAPQRFFTDKEEEKTSKDENESVLKSSRQVIRGADRMTRVNYTILEELIKTAPIRASTNEKLATKIGNITFRSNDIVELEEPKMFISSRSPILLVYHAFYPVDDEARKQGGISSTNREGHHLATGILFSLAPRSKQNVLPSHIFIARGPDSVQIIPFDHPVLLRLNNQGDTDPNGTHVVLFTNWQSPLAFLGGAAVGGLTAWIAEEAGAGEDYVKALSILAGAGATAALSGAYPLAIAIAILFVIVLLMCLFTGCGSDREDDPSSGIDHVGGGSNPLRSDPSYQDSNSYLAPAGSPINGRQTQINLIPHLIDKNLYGLHGGGDHTFTIDDDDRLKEMLSWVAFPGGFGYQLEREFPGKEDRAGSSLRNYFDLFVEKLVQLSQAQKMVNYFGE